MAITAREIGIRFAPPRTDDRRNAIKAQISAKAEELARLIHELVPASREESEAIFAVEQAVHQAHSGVDRRLVLPGELRPVAPVLAAQAGPPAAERLGGA
ncbi:hypothetical protein ACIOFV_07230 [Streptomyces mirabilis]|uniref:Acb2/Tad1 domain-containing protein n=1 Tax=Streptomyces mirabilis TaxID=68239 RepID=UPI00382E81A1